MRIYVRVTPRAGKNEVLKVSDGEYRVKVTAPPEKGKANEKVVELLAYHLAVPKSSVKIIAGKSARIKIVDVDMQD
ncbi:MAG: DUF167 domain-containing protein [Parcubacteria group bacterium]|jgi:hypothetical protein